MLFLVKFCCNLLIYLLLELPLGIILAMTTKVLARQLAHNVVAQKSTSLWHESSFRKLVGFNKITNKEQDRIFNELEMTALGYLLLFLDERLMDKKDDREFVVYINTRELMVEEFLSLMEDAGLTHYHLSLWRSLIKERMKEYKSDTDFIMKESSEWEVFQGKDRVLMPTWARIVTVSASSLRYIRKNDKTSLEDPLWTCLRRWLISLEVDIIRSIKSSDLKHLNVLN